MVLRLKSIAEIMEGAQEIPGYDAMIQRIREETAEESRQLDLQDAINWSVLGPQIVGEEDLSVMVSGVEP